MILFSETKIILTENLPMFVKGKMVNLIVELDDPHITLPNLTKVTGFKLPPRQTVETLSVWLDIQSPKNSAQAQALMQMRDNLLKLVESKFGVGEIEVVEDRQQQVVESAVKDVIYVDRELTPEQNLVADLTRFGITEDWILNYYTSSIPYFWMLDSTGRRVETVSSARYVKGFLQNRAVQGIYPEVVLYLKFPDLWEDMRVLKPEVIEKEGRIILVDGKTSRRGEPWQDSRFVAKVEKVKSANQRAKIAELRESVKNNHYDFSFLEG